MKTTTLIAAAIISLQISAVAEDATDKTSEKEPAGKELKAQTVCPVMGGKINKDSFVDVDGKRIYLCCQGCEKAILADPDKFLKKMEDEGIVLDPAPAEKKEDGK